MLKAAGISAILPELRLSDDGMCYYLHNSLVDPVIRNIIYVECLDISIPHRLQTADIFIYVDILMNPS